jgi:hypothetical protein
MPINLLRIYPELALGATTKPEFDQLKAGPFFDSSGVVLPSRQTRVNSQRLYSAVLFLLRDLFELKCTKVPGDAADFGREKLASDEETTDEQRLASVLGNLILAGYTDPSNSRSTPGDKDEVIDLAGRFAGLQSVTIAYEFKEWVTDAVRRFNANKVLSLQAWQKLYETGTGKDGSAATDTVIQLRNLADVTQRLISRNVAPGDPNIDLKVEQAVAETLAGGFDSQPSSLDISLPDLEAGVAVEIVRDNVLAVQAIYFSSQLEEMRVHATVDKVVEHFQVGMLPISRGPAADKIYAWIKETPKRLSEYERRGIYGRVLGLAMGSANEAAPNREFNDLWRRFLSSVSLKYREANSYTKDEVSVEQVHKAARDLAVNLSLHGYGIAHPAAIEMQAIIREMLSMMDEQAILSAYGVRDRWQLVDRISALYLGGALNGVRYRTMAAAGEKIIRWLADRSVVLASGSATGLSLTDFTGAATPQLKEIADLAERWLAVTGTPDDALRQSANPVDLQTQYTVPMLGQSQGIQRAVEEAARQVGAPIVNLPVIPQA